MTTQQQGNRCPICGRVVPVSTLAYSDAARAFVCADCRAPAKAAPATAAPAIAPPVPSAPPAANGVGGTGGAAAHASDLASLAAARQPSPPRAPRGEITDGKPRPPATAERSQWPWVTVLIVAALCVTGLVIALVAKTGPASDPRRAWDDANRDRIVALKSDAEALTIARKLPEAHAKYRELEKLVGGRAIQDPRLFDLVDQARLDQSRVYTMILHAMNPQTVEKQPLPSSLDPRGVTASGMSGAVDAVPQKQSLSAYPESFDRLKVAAAPQSAATPDAASSAASQPAAGASSAPSPGEAIVTAEPATQAAPAAPPVEAEAAPRPVSYTPITDGEVEQSIRRGVDFLIGNFENGKLRPVKDTGGLEYEGLNALAVYALVQASQAINHPRLGGKGEFLTQCLDQLRGASLEPGGQINGPVTYARSLRASALATYNRPQDRRVLQADVNWLVNAEVDGSYTYDDTWRKLHPRPNDPKPAPQGDPRSHRDGDSPDGSAQVRTLGLASGGADLVLVHNGEVMPPPRPAGPPMPPRPPIYRVPAYQQPRANYRDGAVRYRIPERVVPAPWDNSNSQYGVLGVWAGAEVGIEVPDSYWKAIRAHWVRCQLPSGQWSYTPQDDAAYSMTVGGIASLLVAHDYLDAPMLGQRTAGRQPYDDFITAGLAYMEDADNVMDILQTAKDTMLLAGYNLFGLERVGLASGLKYIGSHDWYAELAAKMQPLQWPSGAWGRTADGRDALIDTSYIVLFLCRGRHPILMNKLKFEGFWTNRPRDVANLAAFTSKEMERPVNWQVVDVRRPPDDWADSPILYLASHRPLELEAEQVKSIRAFINAGGLLFTHADQGSESFSIWAAGLAKQLFPGNALENLSPQHPVYSLNYKLPTPRVRLQGLDNGVRLLMVHSPTDLSSAWQVRATVSRKEAYQLALNLYLYATGKERFRNRLDTRAVPEPGDEPAPQLDVAQVVYDGDWNPEPAAWVRFAKKFQAMTGKRLTVLTAKPAELKVGTHIMGILSGVSGKTPTDADLAPIARFVREGGVLMVDACGGSGPFATAIEAWLTRLDPKAELQPLPKHDPVLTRTVEGTVDLPNEQLRLYAIEKIGAAGTRMKSIKLGKGRVIFTPLDITSGLLGTNTWGILGYAPHHSEAVTTNIVLTTSANAP